MEGTLAKTGIIVRGEANTCDLNDTQGPEIIISGCERAQTSVIDFPEKIRLVTPYCLEIVVIDSLSGVALGGRPDEGTTVEVKKYVRGTAEDFEGMTQPQLSEDSFIRKTFKWILSSEMKPGQYLLKVRAQDGFGNWSLRNLDVEIVEDSFLQLYRVFNAPNPLKNEGTCFYFGEIAEQGSGEFFQEEYPVTAEIKIYNQRGFMVKRLGDVRPRIDISGYDIRGCKDRNAWWNGRDHWGNKLGNGLYFYEVKVRQETSDGSGDGSYRTSSKRNTLLISH
jgi:hypothetical protein